MIDKPVVVLINKIDIDGAVSEEELKHWFRLDGSTTGKVCK